MTVIRVILDGKAFVPKEPLSLRAQSEALVILKPSDPSAQARPDAAIRAHYHAAEGDAEDNAWANATSPQSQRAWDED